MAKPRKLRIVFKDLGIELHDLGEVVEISGLVLLLESLGIETEKYREPKMYPCFSIEEMQRRNSSAAPARSRTLGE